MAGPVRSLADVLAEVRQRCDHENSDFVTDAELESWISQSYADYRDLVIEYAGPDAFLTFGTAVTVAGASIVQVSAYRVVGISAHLSGRWVELKRHGLRDRHRLQDVGGWTSARDTAYMLSGRTAAGLVQVLFQPTPQAVYQLRILHLPNAPTLTSSVDLVTFSGWDEYVISDVCAKVLEKEESDARPFIARRELARERIIRGALQLDSSPRVMTDALELCDDELAALRYS